MVVYAERAQCNVSSQPRISPEKKNDMLSAHSAMHLANQGAKKTEKKKIKKIEKIEKGKRSNLRKGGKTDRGNASAALFRK
jgi:hypothetical protein